MKTNDGESLSSLLLLRENGSFYNYRKVVRKTEVINNNRTTLTPGSALPNENEMCQMLQIGRGTLREAYQILATNGLITRTKVGTYINDRSTIINFAPLSIVSELADYDDILNFRMMFEKECARAAAESITAEELKQLGVKLLMRAVTPPNLRNCLNWIIIFIRQWWNIATIPCSSIFSPLYGIPFSPCCLRVKCVALCIDP